MRRAEHAAVVDRRGARYSSGSRCSWRKQAVAGVAVEQDPPAADGTTSPNYAGTFDSEFRIYHSKQGFNYDSKTLSFFLPAADAAKLTRVGSFYINRLPRIGFFT